MLLRLLASLILTLFSVNATSKVSDDVYINAFIGVGYIYETGNNFIDSDKDSNKIIESALSFTYEYNNNISFSGQIAYREFGEYFTDKAPRIDYANLNYTNSFITNSEQSFSLGRIKAPIGIYNLSRDTPTTRPSIIMPQSTYLDLFRNMMISIDGIMLSSSHQISHGIIDFTLGYGESNIDDNFSRVALGPNIDGSWKSGNITVADIRYRSDNLLFGVSYNDVSPEYLSTTTDTLPVFPVGYNYADLTDGKTDITSYIAFLQYNINRFEFSSEYTYRDVIASGYTPTPPDSRPMEGYYAQLKYAASPSLNLTARYDKLYRKADYKNGFETPYGIDPTWYNNATTSSISINYTIDEHWAVIADMHYVKGSAWLPPFSYQVPESVEKKYWMLSAIEVVYIF